MNKRLIRNSMIYLVFLGVTFFIMYMAPLQSDDYEFASYHAKDFSWILKYCLYYGNGRILGNLTAVFLSNVKIIQVLIKALVISALIFLVPQCVKGGDTLFICLSVLLILGISPVIFAQIFTWTSGFSNYVPPVFLFLICYFIIKECKVTYRNRFIIFLLGLSSQLFVEHSTILNLFVAFVCFIYYWREGEKDRKRLSFIWFWACLVGAAIMVLIPKVFYKSVNRATGYRHIYWSNIFELISNCLDNIFLLLQTYAKCIILWIIWSICGILLLKIVGHEWKYRRFTIVAKAVYIACPIIILILSNPYVLEIMTFSSIIMYVRHVVTIGSMCASVLFTFIGILYIEEKKVRNQLIFYIICAVLAILPFAVVSPFGERCMFLTYIFLVLFILSLLSYVIKKLNLNISCSVYKILFICMLVNIIVLAGAFIRINRWDNKRTAYIETCMERGEDQITVYEIPSNYTFPTYLLEMYYYYDKPGDIVFKVVDYNEWKALNVTGGDLNE